MIVDSNPLSRRRGEWSSACLRGGRFLAEGSGMLVPSFVPGADDANVNLVLWHWGANLPHKVDVYDPSGRLPQNQLSWPLYARSTA